MSKLLNRHMHRSNAFKQPLWFLRRLDRLRSKTSMKSIHEEENGERYDCVYKDIRAKVNRVRRKKNDRYTPFFLYYAWMDKTHGCSGSTKNVTCERACVKAHDFRCRRLDPSFHSKTVEWAIRGKIFFLISFGLEDLILIALHERQRNHCLKQWVMLNRWIYWPLKMCEMRRETERDRERGTEKERGKERERERNTCEAGS